MRKLKTLFVSNLNLCTMKRAMMWGIFFNDNYRILRVGCVGRYLKTEKDTNYGSMNENNQINLHFP